MVPEIARNPANRPIVDVEDGRDGPVDLGAAADEAQQGVGTDGDAAPVGWSGAGRRLGWHGVSRVLVARRR